MDTCIKIFEPASPLLHRRSLAVAFAVLLCQPMVAGAQPSSASLASQAELGTRTAPPSPDMTIPEPAMRAPAAATDSPEAPLNNAHANFAPNDPPGEWRSQARDYANTRYSPLDQITAANVAKLRVAWSFSDGTPNGHEAAPLVVGDTMYMVTPFPNLAYALDLTKAGAPIKWSYDPKPTPMAIGKACCDTVNRGSAYADGKLIYNLLDDHTVAVDAKTGKEVWRTKMGDVTTGMTMTMAPFVVGDKVYVGNSGGELGVWGWLAALDVKTGKELWRAHSSGPDDDVMIGADFKPFYSWMKGKDLGETTWPAGMWKTGAGSVWGWVSYDPEINTDLLRHQQPGPARADAAARLQPVDQRGVRARRDHRHGEVGLSVHAARPVGLRRRQRGHAARPALRRQAAQGAGPLRPQRASPTPSTGPRAKCWSPSPSPIRTGRTASTSKPACRWWIGEMQPKPNVKLSNVCPPDIGGKDWQPSAFSPRTGLVYAGIFNICMDVTDHPQSYIPGTPYDGMEMTPPRRRQAATGASSWPGIRWPARRSGRSRRSS